MDIEYKSAQDIIEEEEAQEDSAIENKELIHSSLANYVMKKFQTAREARRNSGIEDRILDSLRAYNGNYNPKDLAQIKEEGGSEIFMNLTATKCRAASSWIKDILMPARERVYSIKPTPSPDLPSGIKEKIEKALEEEFSALVAPQEADVAQAQKSLRETNQNRRDILDAISDEIDKEAAHAIKRVENIVADQLEEGGWTDALSEYIDDFCILPVSIMKGPVVTVRTRLAWVDGVPTPTEDFIFLNKRVHPIDIYPSPDATSIEEGTLIEHLRMSPSELSELRHVDSYNKDNIENVLENNYGDYLWLATGIEDEKSEEEARGNSSEANVDVYHGLHMHGPVPGHILKDWGVNEVCFESNDPYKMWEVEAILVGNEVIKCVINDDPLNRRPYYKSSFQNIPGSFWGRSIPELMSDIQRMCNACARALSNNMALSSGPQVELYIDRLADSGDIEEMYPRKIWQLYSDKSGGGGRAIQFTQIPSNAKELLAVYTDFELRADDVTSIPRYAYGNEKVGGAATTASGLSMLLESASKGIKDAIRHIDDGLIRPRVEREFYWALVKNPDIKYTGDIHVVTKGSSALTVKGAEQIKRHEFLQITANQIDQNIMGLSGRAALLREVGSDLGIDETIVPTRLEIKSIEDQQQKANAQQQQQMMEIEQQKNQTGLEATKIQIDGQTQMHQETQQIKREELDFKRKKAMQDAELKMTEMEARERTASSKALSSLQGTQMQETTKVDNMNKELSYKIQTGKPGV